MAESNGRKGEPVVLWKVLLPAVSIAVVAVVTVAILWNQSVSSPPSGPSEVMLTDNINDSPWITFTREATFNRVTGGCVNPLPADVSCDSTWGKSQVGAAVARAVGQPPNRCPPCEFYEEESKDYTKIRLSITSTERLFVVVHYPELGQEALLTEIIQGSNIYVIDLPDWPYYGRFHIDLATFDQPASLHIEVIAFRT